LFEHSGYGLNFGDTISVIDNPNKVSLNFTFTYFQASFSEVWMYRESDLFLGNNTGPRICLYCIGSGANRTDTFFYRTETSPILLDRLSLQIRSVSTLSSFTATNAFILTYYMFPTPTQDSATNNSYQVILLTDGVYSFVMMNYERLDFTPANLTFIESAPGIPNYFKPSTKTSNVYVPGQFVFRVDGGGKLKKLNLLYNQF
jgi:hypothetical protein